MPRRPLMIAALLLATLAAPAAHASEFGTGSIRINSPWTKATPERAKVGGGFMTITNTGKDEDRLIGGTAEVAGSLEIHEVHIVNGVMMMRHKNPGITLKPGASVVLKPFSHHLMFMELKEPLVAGRPIRGTLVFEKAGSIEIEYAVEPLGARAPGESATRKHH